MEFSDDKGNKEKQRKSNVCCKASENTLLELSSDTSINSGEEKCDIGPEHSKKSCDTSPEDESIGDSLDEGSKHDSSSGPESCKCYVNNSKSCDINLTLSSSTSTSVTVGDNNNLPSPEFTDVSKSLAFTIDFGDDKVINSKKLNDIVQRFQKRHRRGVSLSKLDDKSTSSSSSTTMQQQSAHLSSLTKSKPPLKKSIQKLNDNDNNSCNSSQVKLRDKSLLNSTKDSNQRHSWSPRTSVNNVSKSTDDDHQQYHPPVNNTFKPKSATLQKAIKDVQLNQTNQQKQKVEQQIVCQKAPLEYENNSDNDSVSDAGTYTIYGDNYTEEQKAQMCIDKFPKLIDNDDDDERNNEFIEPTFIDDETAATITTTSKTLEQSKNLNYCDTRQSNIEPNLEHLELDNIQERMRKNINSSADVTFYGGTSSDIKPTKTSYLEKIKSKVKNIGDRAFHKNRLSFDKQLSTTTNIHHQQAPIVDIGNFTSVTASGVFSKKPTTPQLSTIKRRNSLTKSQIDNSEYIQNNVTSAVNEKLFNSYTDYEKARHHEYKLNIFTPSNRRTDSEKYQKNISERLAIETAETKNDWIQEWAKNARKNTTTCIDDISSSTQQQQQRKMKFIEQDLVNSLPSKNHYDQFGDNLDRNYSSTKNNDRIKRNDLSDLSKSGHQKKPNSNQLRTPYVQNYYQTQYNQSNIYNNNCDGSEFESEELSSVPSEHYGENMYGNKYRGQSRPPISPSKIPSPMHSLRRGRSCSANRDKQHGGSNTVSKNY